VLAKANDERDSAQLGREFWLACAGAPAAGRKAKSEKLVQTQAGKNNNGPTVAANSSHQPIIE
jgi:hypothetical protein